MKRLYQQNEDESAIDITPMLDIVFIMLIFFVVMFQFVYSLLTGSRNEKLVNLGYSLSTYVYQIMSYLTFNTEEHPYPFSDWPKKETKIDSGGEVSK